MTNKKTIENESDLVAVFEIARVALYIYYEVEFLAESLDISDEEMARLDTVVERFLAKSEPSQVLELDDQDLVAVFEIARVEIDRDAEFVAESLDISDEELKRLKDVVETYLRESPAQDPALELLHRYPETVAFISDRAACNGFVEDGIIPMPTTPADWLAWIEDEVEMQNDRIREYVDDLNMAGTLLCTVVFRNELVEVADGMRKLGAVPGTLPWQDEGPFVIYTISEALEEKELVFWNNESGWGSLVGADRYSAEEKEQYHLPMGGQWISLERAQSLCPHEWEPTDTEGHSMECLRCGKAISIYNTGEWDRALEESERNRVLNAKPASREPVEEPSPSQAPEIHWLSCDWHRPPCGWEGTSLEAGWDEEADEWTCPRCGGSEKLRDMGVVPQSVLEYAQMTRDEFYTDGYPGWGLHWEYAAQKMPWAEKDNLHRILVHTALVAGHRLPVDVAAEYPEVVDALKETTGCYLTEEPGWSILLTDSDALVECGGIIERWAYGKWACDPSTEPQTPGDFMAWFADEAKDQREWAAGEADEHEAEQMRMYAEMLEAIVKRLRDAGVTPARLPWEEAIQTDEEQFAKLGNLFKDMPEYVQAFFPYIDFDWFLIRDPGEDWPGWMATFSADEKTWTFNWAISRNNQGRIACTREEYPDLEWKAVEAHLTDFGHRLRDAGVMPASLPWEQEQAVTCPEWTAYNREQTQPIPAPQPQLVIIDVYLDGSCLYIVQDTPSLDADLAAWQAQDNAYCNGQITDDEYMGIAAWLEKAGHQMLSYRTVEL